MKFFLSIFILAGLIFFGIGCLPTPNDGIGSWQTYQNEACGFSFNYPPDTVLYPDKYKQVGVTTAEDIVFQLNQDGEVPPFYYISVECDNNLATMVAALDDDDFSVPKESIKTLGDYLMLNTLPYIKYIGQTEIDGQIAFKTIVGADNSYSLWLEKGEIVYVISFSPTSEAGNIISPIQQEILSSFKFTN